MRFQLWAVFAILATTLACNGPTKPSVTDTQDLRDQPTVYDDDGSSYGQGERDLEEDTLEEEASDYLSETDLTSSDLPILQSGNQTNLNWEPIFFDFDDANLTDQAKEALNLYAANLRSDPSLMVLLEGHCDSRGTEDYNLALGERRAQTVKRFLMSLGIGEDRLNTISYGELRPLDLRESENAWSRNRRVAFTF